MEPVLNPNSTRYQALLQLLRTAEFIWNASRTFFEHWNLSPSQFNILNLLGLVPEGMSQVQLSRELIMHRSNVTGLIDRLEARHLVQRHAVPGDRRSYQVVLTQNGRDLLDEILPHYYQAAEDVWGNLPRARINQLLHDLQQVTTKAAEIAEKQREPN